MVHTGVVCLLAITSGLMAAVTEAVTCSYTPRYKNCDCSKMGGVTSEERNLIQVYCVNQHNLTEIPQTLPSSLGRFYATEANMHRLTLASLTKFPRIKEIHLLRCQLEYIQNGTFLKQQNLQELLLGENKVKALFTDTFIGLKFLRRLILRRNFVAKLTRGVFRHLQSLVYLDISDNIISVVEDGAFNGLNFLKTLIFGGHKLRKFGRYTFGYLPSLYKLDASFGLNLGEIDDKCFAAVPDLKILHLNDNLLQYLPIQSYRVISGLEELDLSSNNLRFLPSDAFTGMKSLQTLFLNSANLSFLQNGSLNTLMVLKTLHLHDNPLSCDCNLRWLLEWLNGTTKLGFKLDSPSKIKCSYPAQLNGSDFLCQNVSSFKCSCKECQKTMRCSGLKNFTCNCNNGTVADSCDVICQSQESPSRKPCLSGDGRCYCSQQIPSCHRNAVLQIIQDRYTCICNEGYSGNEHECTDLNECLLENNRCYRNTTRCINTDGSYRCACRPGYTEQAANVNSCAVIKLKLTILLVKATEVKVSWEPEIKNASCKLAYADVGVKSAEIAWRQTVPIDCASKSYTLEGLKADTLYKLKMVLVERSSETDIDVELVSKTFKTKSVVGDVSGSTEELSYGSIVAIAVLCVLLPTCLALGTCFVFYRRKRRKHRNSLSRLTRPHGNIAQNGVRYIPDEIQFSNVKEGQLKTICKGNVSKTNILSMYI